MSKASNPRQRSAAWNGCTCRSPTSLSRTIASRAAWKTHGTRLIAAIREGSRILVHCKGGLGRAGTVAAIMLVELGMAPEHAIRAVRTARKGAIETLAQEKFIRGYAGAAVD